MKAIPVPVSVASPTLRRRAPRWAAVYKSTDHPGFLSHSSPTTSTCTSNHLRPGPPLILEWCCLLCDRIGLSLALTNLVKRRKHEESIGLWMCRPPTRPHICSTNLEKRPTKAPPSQGWPSSPIPSPSSNQIFPSICLHSHPTILERGTRFGTFPFPKDPQKNLKDLIARWRMCTIPHPLPSHSRTLGQSHPGCLTQPFTFLQSKLYRPDTGLGHLTS